jgi:hypothetical protein
MPLKDTVITSETAERMLERVSPIYDESYVGLWMFEAIGREYDKLWDIVRSLPDQLFPESTTWAIELWEQRYGIVPDDRVPLETRRRKVLSRQQAALPMTPANLERLVSSLAGCEARVEDHIGDYTFGIWLTALKLENERALRNAIDKVKPSHLSYTISYDITAPLYQYQGGLISTHYDYAIRQV